MQNPHNPDAGYVDFPVKTMEVRAVLRSANISFRATPYYRLRWGERGRRFAFSDSGWLATLMGHSDDMVGKQTLWLGRVLANRGMPTWLLTRHLGVLHRQLIREGATPRETESLLHARSTLLEQQRQVLPDEALVAWSQRFAELSGQRSHPLLTHIGLLYAGAWVDQAMGMRNAVSTLSAWMADPARWPASWIAGCEAFLDAMDAELGDR